jgi:hypothetical protein
MVVVLGTYPKNVLRAEGGWAAFGDGNWDRFFSSVDAGKGGDEESGQSLPEPAIRCCMFKQVAGWRPM